MFSKPVTTGRALEQAVVVKDQESFHQPRARLPRYSTVTDLRTARGTHASSRIPGRRSGANQLGGN